jgi:AhpD family alkylhydroperoxidase
MTRRIAFEEIAPEGVQRILDLERYVRSTGLEPSLLELVRLAASYRNGCAYCVDMHTKDARERGETEQRLYAVPVWRETPFFSARERAALAWAEAVTELGPEGVPDALYADTLEAFGAEDLVSLTFAVVAINCWNRLAIALGADVGSYEPGQLARVQSG